MGTADHRFVAFHERKKKAFWWNVYCLAAAASVCSAAGVLYLAADFHINFVTMTALVPCACGVGTFGAYHFRLKAARVYGPDYGDATGLARMGRLEDLKQHGGMMDSDRGKALYCGYCEGEKVYYPGDRHAVVFGPTGVGKDTSLIFPNLLQLNDSVIIFDPKGEAYAVCGKHRASLGYPDVVVNPMGLIDGRSDGFNILLGFKVHDNFFGAKCGAIAEGCATVNPRDPHWGRRTQALIEVLVMREKWREAEIPDYVPTMKNVMAMLFLPYEVGDKDKRPSLKKILTEIAQHKYEPMAMLAQSFISSESKEIEGVLATATSQCKCLRDAMIMADMSKHPQIDGEYFSWNDLKRTTMTVYVILPDTEFETYGTYLRLLVGDALDILMRSPRGKNNRPRLWLNEIGSIQRLDALKRAMSVARGKGIQIITFWQYFAQPVEVYGHAGAKSFLANAGWRCAFGTDDDETQTYFSKQAGTQTVISIGTNNPQSEKAKSISARANSQPLLRAEDIAAIPDRQTVNFIRPMRTGIVRLDVPLYTEICEGFSPNPYH